MYDQFTLADIKAAPLSIMVFLSLNGNRAVSVSDLAAETGYSEKPIRTGLRKLQELGVIVSPRNNRYQLTGREYQLPLSWGEKILPAGDSPELPGDYPGKTGVSPELEKRVSLLEKAVFGYQEPGDSPEMKGDYPLWDSENDDEQMIEALPRVEYSGNIPGKLGVFPIEQRNKEGSKVPVIKGSWSDAGESPEEAGNIPDKTGDSPDPLINNINNNQPEEVSKYVSRSTYLLNNQSNEVNSLTPAGEIPEEVNIRWKTMLSQMIGAMDRTFFSSTIKHAHVIGYEDGHYTVAVKNAFVKDLIETRLQKYIEKILSGIEDREVSVSFVVDSCVKEDSHNNGTGNQTPQAGSDSLTLLPMPEDPAAAELTEICNDYLLEPAGIEYSNEQMQELISMQPDSEVLRWILPKATMFENAKKWCAMDIRKAKKTLLRKYGIIGAAQAELSNNTLVTMDLISEVCQELCPEDKGLAVYRMKEMAKE